jgi:hypothetical protein
VSEPDNPDSSQDKPVHPTPPGRPRRARPASDQAFDIWLDRSLHAMFDEVAKEPIPPELLRLIERDRKG